MTNDATFPLAVCAEMIFLDLPVLERIRRIDALGFMIEIWDWARHDIKALKSTGAKFSSMTGYVNGGLVDEASGAELLRTARLTIPVAKELGITRLTVHGGALDHKGLPLKPAFVVTGNMWSTAIDTLKRLAEIGAKEDVIFALENLNAAVDHPGVPFARAEDCLALVASVNHPHLRMMLDLYHAQIGEGNLIALLARALPFIGEIQVADVPGRHEPGAGELNYPNIAKSLVKMGYRGAVALEAFAESDDALALQRFRSAFTPPFEPRH
jgi:hydroxypyruvate isomerase